MLIMLKIYYEGVVIDFTKFLETCLSSKIPQKKTDLKLNGLPFFSVQIMYFKRIRDQMFSSA